MDVYIDQDNIGPGDLYTMNGAGDRYTLTGWSVQYSTTGRVFVMNNASQSVYIWDGVASSQGSATIYASSDAADAIVNVRGTVRNTAANGVALSLNGSSAHVFVSETGLIYASEADAVGILLTSSDLTGVAVINNEGRILGNDAIVRTGAQNVEIVNDGSIYGQSSAYVDRYGGVDAITNNGAMGAINLGGGADSYFGQHGRNSGGVYGGAGNDLLFGGRDEDYLYGGYDDDRLFGGAGRDRLFGHAGNDQISGGDGADRLVGGAGDDRLNGGAGVDSLIGDAGNDWLNGGAGRDLMVGRDGDDTYWVDNVRDIVSESVGQGRDRVFSSVTFSLSRSYLEDLTLTGSTNIDGAGNESNNVMTGNAGDNRLSGMDGKDTLRGGDGADTLIGGSGVDVLTGGGGNDSFQFATLTDERDRIVDFGNTSGDDDRIVLDNAAFTRLRDGTVAEAHFRVGAQPLDADDYLIYNPNTGVLTYDADGNGAAQGIQIALLQNKAALTVADFLVI